MAQQFPRIDPAHRKFIEKQHIFFVGSAAATGRVNISPKGMESLRVLDQNRIIWRNLTGSGNETAGHLAEANRITLMWAGFEARPLILRAYGTARVVQPDAPDWYEMVGLFDAPLGARQVFDVAIELVQTSCGYGVPFFDYTGERDTLARWAEDKGPEGIRAYWREKNRATIDGFPTGIPGDGA